MTRPPASKRRVLLDGRGDMTRMEAELTRPARQEVPSLAVLAAMAARRFGLHRHQLDPNAEARIPDVMRTMPTMINNYRLTIITCSATDPATAPPVLSCGRHRRLAHVERADDSVDRQQQQQQQQPVPELGHAHRRPRHPRQPVAGRLVPQAQSGQRTGRPRRAQFGRTRAVVAADARPGRRGHHHPRHFWPGGSSRVGFFLYVYFSFLFYFQHKATAVRVSNLVCQCPYVGNTRMRVCTCIRSSYTSPLARVHWKRIIVDEGHVMATKSNRFHFGTHKLSTESRYALKTVCLFIHCPFFFLQLGNNGNPTCSGRHRRRPRAIAKHVHLLECTTPTIIFFFYPSQPCTV